jgi:hypothetical protein
VESESFSIHRRSRSTPRPAPESEEARWSRNGAAVFLPECSSAGRSRKGNLPRRMRRRSFSIL